MNPKQVLLKKITTIQNDAAKVLRDLDQLFEMVNSFDVDADEAKSGSSDPVKFVSIGSDWSIKYGGMVMQVRKEFTMPDGGPISNDWFQFLYDMEKRNVRPDLAREELQKRLVELKRRDVKKPNATERKAQLF